jgi:hypothetical protein
LNRAGHRIVLARDVLATHLKRWSLAEMMRTDIFRRGVPWMLLIKRSGTVETDLNVKVGQKACVALTGLTLLVGLYCIVNPWAVIGVGIGLAGIVALNGAFFTFLVRRKGFMFACAALPLHLIYYCCCGFSVFIALIYWQVKSHRTALTRVAGTTRTDPAMASILRPAARWKWASRFSRWMAQSK